MNYFEIIYFLFVKILINQNLINFQINCLFYFGIIKLVIILRHFSIYLIFQKYFFIYFIILIPIINHQYL